MAQMGNRDKWVLARYWWAYQADSYLAALTAYGPAPCLRGCHPALWGVWRKHSRWVLRCRKKPEARLGQRMRAAKTSKCTIFSEYITVRPLLWPELCSSKFLC